MIQIIPELVATQAKKNPDNLALADARGWLNYEQLQQSIIDTASAMQQLELAPRQRVAIFLPKVTEAVIAMFATSCMGGIFVPINPILKAKQVQHIISDCDAQLLVTNNARYQMMKGFIPRSIKTIVLIDDNIVTNKADDSRHYQIMTWQQLQKIADDQYHFPLLMSSDIAAIFYTSGSTGKPKGVVLSQQNIVLGARSVVQYLQQTDKDRLLAVLPLSFDYGFSQLTTTFYAGGSCFLMEYLFPQDIIKQLAKQKITGLALVPPLWNKLSNLNFPEEVSKRLRFFCNSGGAMSATVLQQLRDKLPTTKPYLMYGLTEAFRSCYLPPEDIDSRPGSFGKAIPNARIHVLNSEGQPCLPGEEGELVHSGPLVSRGYWNSPEKTAQRFKAAPMSFASLDTPEIAVWSGDIVKQDEDGYFYFVSRNDELIKTSGYRVSPAEIEEVLYQSQLVEQVVVIAAPDTELGQAIVAAVVLKKAQQNEAGIALLGQHIAQELPVYMRPKHIEYMTDILKNPNGKFDRSALITKFSQRFL